MEKNYRTIWLVSFFAGLAIALVLIVTLDNPNKTSGKEIASRSPASLDAYSYLQQLNTIAQDSSLLISGTQSIFEMPLESQDVKTSLTQVKQAHGKFSGFYSQAQAMLPPQELKKYHQQITHAIHSYEKGFLLSEVALNEKNPQKMTAAHEMINNGASEFFNATQLIVQSIK